MWIHSFSIDLTKSYYIPNILGTGDRIVSQSPSYRKQKLTKKREKSSVSEMCDASKMIVRFPSWMTDDAIS